MESVPEDTQYCPPDIEEIAEGYCMETFDRPARLAFEDHYLSCTRCASVVVTTDESIRSLRAALRRLRYEGQTPTATSKARGRLTRRLWGICFGRYGSELGNGILDETTALPETMVCGGRRL
jgi:hypothetical protein